MRLSDATVAIRPRSTWEAMDLGVLMSQQHRRLLMTSWAIVTLPLFVVLSLLLWDSPSLAVLIFWWLKPAYERLPLYILSKALFGETPTLKQALREFPRLLKPQLLASLTWRRLSLSRSFLLPVVQLEGLDGTARQQRLQVLLQRNAGAAQWLTIIGMHLETALWIGLMVLFYMLLPQQIETDWDWQSLILDADHHWRWLEHLTNAFYALVLVVWEPIYVACGFSLYLNRRTALEAWDIELVFRRLRQRLNSSALGLLLAVCLLLPAVPPVWAAADPASAPEAPRLLHQPLTSQAAHDSIKALLDTTAVQEQGKRDPLPLWRRPGHPGRGQTRRASAMAENPAWLARRSTLQCLGGVDRSAAVGRVAHGRRLADLALSRVSAHLRQSPGEVARPRQATCAATSIWSGPDPRNPCPTTSLPAPNNSGRPSRARRWACSIAACSAVCCTILP